MQVFVQSFNVVMYASTVPLSYSCISPFGRTPRAIGHCRTEPGDNWEEVDYRWGKYDDPVPGWTLPATWCYADDNGVTGGPRTHGWLRLTYRSYGNGCMPVMSVRKYLRKRTLAGMKRII